MEPTHSWFNFFNLEIVLLKKLLKKEVFKVKPSITVIISINLLKIYKNRGKTTKFFGIFFF